MQKTPEQWLEETAPSKQRGLFKLFLGYAPGVGKTYNMLSEGIRRFSRGENVVIGVVESHGRPATTELAGGCPRCHESNWNIKGPRSTKWTSMRFSNFILKSYSWTNWPIPTSKAATPQAL